MAFPFDRSLTGGDGEILAQRFGSVSGGHGVPCPSRSVIIPMSSGALMLGGFGTVHHEEVIGGKLAKPIQEPASQSAVAIGYSLP
jgi:hypothetical protein